MEWTGHQLTLYPDEEGSDGKKAYSWVYSSCKSKMGKTTVYSYNERTVESIQPLNHRLLPGHATTLNSCFSYSHLLIFCHSCLLLRTVLLICLFSFQLSIPRNCLPALSEEDLEAIRAALRNGKLEAVVSHAPDDGRGIHIFIRDLSS